MQRQSRDHSFQRILAAETTNTTATATGMTVHLLQIHICGIRMFQWVCIFGTDSAEYICGAWEDYSQPVTGYGAYMNKNLCSTEIPYELPE